MNRRLISDEWINRLKVGQTFERAFESFDELKGFIIDHGVQTERIVRSYKKDTTRCLAYCKMNDPSLDSEKRCNWRIRAIRKKKTGTIAITQAHSIHSCEAADHWKRRMHTYSDRLAQKIMDIIMKNRQTRACSLRDTTQALLHPDIKYHTAFVAKQKALEKLDGKESDSFYFIHAHYQHIMQQDRAATVKYAAPNGQFEFLFVSPGAAREAYKHCRPLVAFDGTFTRSKYPQILLIATALDANNTIFMLAYCMVPSENPREWLRFLKLMQDAIPELEQPNTIFISDWEKGLLTGVEEVFPQGFHAFCSWHLGDNCRTNFNKQAQKEFEPLVYANTPDQFKRRLDRIKAKNAKLADYIQKTAPPKHYSRAFCLVRRWGHETSQQAESLNRALKPQRQEVAFKQSNLLWDYMMNKFYEKGQLAASVTTPFPPNIMTILKHTEEKATLLIVDASSSTECRVTDCVGRQFLVQFEPEWKCTCGDWQDILLPCVHAWRACTRLQKRQFDYVSDFYQTKKFQQTYSSSVPAILHDDLQRNEFCGPPAIRRRRGRPTEKLRMRFPPEDPVRRCRKCSHCNEVGHDKRKCPSRDALLSQAKGRGPTLDSEEEDVNASGSNVDDVQSRHLESESESPEEDFYDDAVAARKDAYVSDEDERQVEMDVSMSCPYMDFLPSQPSTEDGFYSQLLGSVQGGK